MENPREGIKNHDLSKNKTFLLGLACIMYGKEISLQLSCLSLLPTLYFHLKIYGWVLALIAQLHVPLIL